MSVGKDSVPVQVDDLNLSAVTEDKLVFDSSAEQSKTSLEYERDQPKVDGNTDANMDEPNVASKVLEEGMKGDPNSPRVCVKKIIFDPSPGGALKQSQGVSKSNEKGVAKPLKRKKALIDSNVHSMDKESLIAECRRELDCLFEYYKELSARILNLEESIGSSNNSLIACFLEERNMSYSKLVDGIYEKLKGKEGVTLTYVRGAVLSVAQRISYGITNAEADVLEDESESCLWCWETRDMKLLPANQRGDLNARRAGRKKIHERISALSATLSALAIPEIQDNYKSNLNKASIKLGKTLNLEEIRSLVEKKKQKNDTNMVEKTAKLKEKESICEIQKEKLQTEKEIKRLQEKSEKEAKRREKEEAESKKQLKKQQEESEKDRRRRERAEADLKEQRSVKKQATIMERFLKAKKSNNNLHSMEKQSSMTDPTCDSPCKVEVVNATTSLMDNAFSMKESLALEDLRKLHTEGWHKLSRCNRSCHWGVRHNQKIEVFKELKLHESSIGLGPSGKDETPIKQIVSCKGFSREPSLDKLVVDGSAESFVNDHTHMASLSVRILRKKLLQFDKSNRPAYYGTWSKKSSAVVPRNPFKKDPDLDYDVDSDVEWEEEEPGESLSDCEKDADEERQEEENLKFEDEEESEDDFFVPDGYLSENEGVQVEGKPDRTDDDTRSSPTGQSEVESEEIKILQQQQKCLQTLTEQALRKVHPFIILNLMHEKSEIKMVEDISGTGKIEQMCLQALCMQACPGGCIVDTSVDQCPEKEDQEVPQSQNISNITSTPSPAAIQDSDLPEFVSSIQSNSQGINKVLESLQSKFPTTPKSHLRNKVKEVSDYVDNRWQTHNILIEQAERLLYTISHFINEDSRLGKPRACKDMMDKYCSILQVKKEILDRLGLSTSPDKRSKPKGITTFFSKRCLPPARESISASESSPQKCPKTEVFPGDGTQ